MEKLDFLVLKEFVDLFGELLNLEGLALYYVERNGIDQELGSQQYVQLSHIEFRNQNFFKTLKYFRKIIGKWIEVPQVNTAD